MTLKYFIRAALLVLTWSTIGAPGVQAAVKVVGYATSWSGAAADIQYSKITHINYAFLLPNSDGSVQAIDNPVKLQSIVSSAHASGVKVMISVGGWMNGDPSPFVNLSGNATSRQNFVNNVVNFTNQYGLDGVDIDWEHPTSATSGLYGTLMNQLASALHGQGKSLSSAVVFGGAADPIPSSIFGSVDWLNVMDYDNNNFDHSTYASAVSALDYWSGRGLPAAKTNLGVPFYSHPASYTFAQLLSMGADPNADVWNGQGYNGIATIKAKTNLVFDRGAGGIMIWELGQDATGANSLVSAIDSVVKQRQGTTNTQAYFMIVNQGSGKALDLIAGNTANGANTNQWSYDYNGPNQRWALQPTSDGAHFKLISWVSGKAVSVANNSTSNSAQLWAWDYNNDPSQQWDLVDAGNGWYNIKNVRSSLLMDVDGGSTADNAKVQQYANTNSGAQRWRLQPWGTYSIRAASGRYVCVQGAGSANGSPIIQYDGQNNPWFKWTFTSEGDGFYGLFSLNAPGRVLCVKDGSYAAGYNTHLWDYNPSNAGDQKLRIVPKTNGKFKFYWKHDGMTWDIPGGATGNNVNLQQYPDNGNSWQEFGLERTP
jgi:hypothetical protein